MTFEPTIKVGDLLTVVAILLGGLGFLWTMRGELNMLAQKLQLQSEDLRMQSTKLEKLAEVITLQAVQSERLNQMDRRIEDLRHGRGFVQRDVDGLWSGAGKAREG
jgi:hypothetical protein